MFGSDRVFRASARLNRALASAGFTPRIDIFCVAQPLNIARAQIAMSNSATQRNKQVRNVVVMTEGTP
jgi:hypothetical protein